MVQKKTTAAKPAAKKAGAVAGPEAVEAVVKAGTEAATKGYEQAVALTKEQVKSGQLSMDAVVKAGAEATKGYEKAVSTTRTQVEKTSQAVFKGYDDLTVVGKDNIDACMKSGTILAKGLEALGKEVAKYTQASIEKNLAATQTMMGARTLREAVDLQSNYARESFDSLVAETTKLTELSVEVANQAIEPLQTRANVTAEKLFKPLSI
jgi:phasin family protein